MTMTLVRSTEETERSTRASAPWAVPISNPVKPAALSRHENRNEHTQPAKALTWNVNVHWQAIPESIEFHQLNETDQHELSQRFVGEIDALVPPGDQARWQNFVVTGADYGQIAAKVNAILTAEVTPPVGTELVLSANATLWVRLSGGGHGIMHCAMLKDAGATATRNWTISASQAGVAYTARLALRYEVLVARLP